MGTGSSAVSADNAQAHARLGALQNASGGLVGRRHEPIVATTSCTTSSMRHSLDGRSARCLRHQRTFHVLTSCWTLAMNADLSASGLLPWLVCPSAHHSPMTVAGWTVTMFQENSSMKCRRACGGSGGVMRAKSASVMWRAAGNVTRTAGCPPQSFSSPCKPSSERDRARDGPPSLKTDRDDVADPDSIGVTVHLGVQEGSVVLFRGGWCDVEYWSGDASDEPVMGAPGYPDTLTVDEYGRLLDSFINRFR
jgi:hypothetical protein